MRPKKTNASLASTGQVLALTLDITRGSTPRTRLASLDGRPQSSACTALSKICSAPAQEARPGGAPRCRGAAERARMACRDWTEEGE